jgi:SepF-like predicted cell division protein (DUF552 family)
LFRLLRRLLSGSEDQEAEPLPPDLEGEREPTLKIVVSRVTDASELDELIEELYDGNVLILDLGPLMRRGEHERAVRELKRTAIGLGGFIGVIRDTVVLVTSDNVEIEKRG